jgi:hypothetical protein
MNYKKMYLFVVYMATSIVFMVNFVVAFLLCNMLLLFVKIEWPSLVPKITDWCQKNSYPSNPGHSWILHAYCTDTVNVWIPELEIGQFSNGWFYNHKNGPNWTGNPLAIWFPMRFSNGYNKMAAENGLVLGWPVPAEIDQSKARFVWFSHVNCSFLILN